MSAERRAETQPGPDTIAMLEALSVEREGIEAGAARLREALRQIAELAGVMAMNPRASLSSARGFSAIQALAIEAVDDLP